MVAAIHGHCIGAGMDLVCSADVRLCSVDVSFAVAEVTLGLAADVGTLQRLPKLVGHQSIVRELCLTGRNFTAAEALHMGFVSRTCATRAALFRLALARCTEIARHSPVAVQGTKRALLYARDHSVADGLEQIATYNALALQGDDVARAWRNHGPRRNDTTTAVSFPPMPPQSRL